MNPRWRIAWPLAAIALAFALAWTLPFERLQRAWLDLTLRALAPDVPAQATVVVDVDEASLQALRARHGGWPLPRDLHAEVARRLLDAGALAVVFNFDFSDSREGDAVLGSVAEQSGRVVFGVGLAAQAKRAPTSLDVPHWQAHSSLHRMPAHGLRPPAVGLTTQQRANAWGVISMPLDADGQLRCLPLLFDAGAMTLPSLPLAALAAAQQSPQNLDAPARGIAALGQTRWAVHDQSCAMLVLPKRADAVPALSYAAVVDPALSEAAVSRASGRTVFIGSPSFLDAPVMTPYGQIGSTQWLALAHESLHAGRALAPPSAWGIALMLAVALMPLAWSAWRDPPRPRHDLMALAVAALALVVLAGLLQAWLHQLAKFPLALLLLGCSALIMGWRRQRWLRMERTRALHAQSAAEAANRAKSEFLAHMSHEIRTPLNALLGVSQLLSETPLTASQRRYVEVFSAAGAHLRQLIDDLLDLSRVEAGRLEVAHAPFAPRAMGEELAAMFEPRARAQGLRFEFACDTELPAFVLGDAQRVRQILLNLLGNALKFTPQGSVGLTMQVGQTTGELEFVVHDTGVGIAAERQQQVFEPFTQADGGVTRQHGGSGLGLTISRRLARAMGGDIELRSDTEHGTRCHVRLPLPACPAPAQPAKAEPAPVPVAWAGLRLLLAEDNAHNVLVLQGMLEGLGLQLDVAVDGQQAVRLAATGTYDLILMDVRMPKLDGHAATRAIRESERRKARAAVPIVALSANAMPSDRQASLAAGCDVHLSKPIDRAQLLATLQACLKLRLPAAPEADESPSPAPQDDIEPSALIDTRAALQRMGGDQALYDRVREAACSQLQDWTAAFDAARRVGHVALCQRHAHDLKGLAATLGASTLASQARALELACEGDLNALGPARDAAVRSLQALLRALQAQAG